MTAWVASVPASAQGVGGDLHFMSSCDHDLISSLKGKVKKKNLSRGRNLSTFAAQLFEQDLL